MRTDQHDDSHPAPARGAPVRTIMVPWPAASDWRAWGLKALALAVIVYVAYVVRDIWIPLILAFLLATVLDPIVDRLEMRGWTRAAAASLIYTAFLVVMVGGVWLAYPHIAQQVEDIRAGITKYFPDGSPAGLKRSFQSEQIGFSPTQAEFASRVVQSIQTNFLRSSSRLSGIGMTFLSNLIWTLIIPIIAFYALRDYHLILGKGLLLVPRSRRDLVQTAVAETTAIFAKYLRAMVLVSVLNGLATWAMLALFGVKGALVLGLLALIAYNVPYIGAIAINLLTASIAFLQGGSELMIKVTLVGLFLHHVLFDQIIAPRILGGQVGLHPILSIVALLVGNLLLGIIGMILAVPIAACIQIGVLALVPKLRHEIEIPKDPTQPTDTVEQLAGAIQDTHAKTDATEELHRSVTAAVESIEEQLDDGEPSGKASLH